MTKISEEKTKLCVSLGYFDCMHIGHRSIISLASSLAKEKNFQNAVFTFSGFAKNGKGQVYLLEERKKLFYECGVEKIIVYEFNERIKNLSAKEFLDGLLSTYKIGAFVCGKDYRFGNNASGDVKFLSEYCIEKKVELNIVDDFIVDDTKVSSTQIKELIVEGNVEKANELLGKKYFITGKVVHGRGEGHLFGFPTANINRSSEKIYPKEGVYATKITVGDKEYKAVTSVGAKPTFMDASFSIESFIVGFDGDLYGKEITVNFYKRLRDLLRFDSPNALKERIMQDSKWEE